jgi:hypothetical protein
MRPSDIKRLGAGDASVCGGAEYGRSRGWVGVCVRAKCGAWRLSAQAGGEEGRLRLYEDIWAEGKGMKEMRLRIGR